MTAGLAMAGRRKLLASQERARKRIEPVEGVVGSQNLEIGAVRHGDAERKLGPVGCGEDAV